MAEQELELGPSRSNSNHYTVLPQRVDLLLRSQKYSRCAVRLQIQVTRVEEIQQLLHGGPDIAAVHQGKAELQGPPGRGETRQVILLAKNVPLDSP